MTTDPQNDPSPAPRPDPLPDPLAVAGEEMVAGERLLWADRPLPAELQRRAWPLAALGGLFLLLALAWLSRLEVSTGALVAGLPLVALGIGLALAPWWRPKLARRTVYAISDQRLVIMEGWPKQRVTSYGPDQIDVIERRERPGGRGDLVFRREFEPRLRHPSDRGPNRRYREREIGFFGIAEIRKVEAAIHALKRGQLLGQSRAPAAPAIGKG